MQKNPSEHGHYVVLTVVIKMYYRSHESDINFSRYNFWSSLENPKIIILFI